MSTSAPAPTALDQQAVADFAARGVAHISGQRVLRVERVERIDPPAPQSGKAQAATEIEAREVAA